MEIKKTKVLLDRANKWFEAQIKDNIKLCVGDRVVVDTQKCEEAGSVVCTPYTDELKKDEPIMLVLRKLTKEDELKIKNNLEKESKIKKETKNLIKKHNLDIKIVSVQLALDSSKIIISFTSEDRVDFRDLVKDLANIYKTRIELRQIGARDEVKIVGAIGPCGRICCCNGYFNEFCHVSIKMAKVQGLSLNPTNISGMCGRLMCCLAYENEYYSECSKKMPKINSIVETPDGKGQAVFLNFLKQTVDVKFEDEIKTYPLDKLRFNKTQGNSNEDMQ